MKTTRLLATLVAALSLSAFAGELDPAKPANLPAGILVRVDPAGNTQIYKIDAAQKPSNDQEALALLNTTAKDSNKIQAVDASKGELDQTSSSPAWFHFGFGWGGGGYRGWGGGYGGYYGGGYGGYYGGGYGGYPYYGLGYYGGCGCGYQPYYYNPCYSFGYGGWNNYYYYY